MGFASTLINLKSWRLGLPVDSKGGIRGDSVTIDDPWNYDNSNFFHRMPDGAIRFQAEVHGATTPGSEYARSELRETIGGQAAWWQLSQGGTMTATLAVNEIPKRFDGEPAKVVIGQIHGKSSELVRLYFQDNSIFFANDKAGPKNQGTYFYPVNAEGKTANISLGEKFSYKIDARGDTLTVVVYADGDVYTSTTKINSVWQNDKFYFKAGMYLGVNEKSGTGTGEADFYGLDYSHKPGEGLGGLVDGGLLPEDGHTITGTDLDNTLIGGTGNDIISGLAGNDHLTGDDGIDKLLGGTGNDYLDGGRGADTLVGGDGDDTFVVDNAYDVVVEDNDGGVDTIQSFINYLLQQNVENLTLLGTSDLTATGNDGDNVIIGNDGSNVIDGGLGDDEMAGGSGDDTYIVNSIGDHVTEHADGGTDTVQTSVNNYHLDDNVENLTLTGNAVVGYGNDGDNFILGTTGDNVLYGLGGNDYLKGWLGNDKMYGGTGDDTYKVSAAGDQVIEYADEGNDTVVACVDYTLGANVENLTLQGSTAVIAGGNALDNVIIGNIKSNFIYGGLGNDTLTGGGGNDRFVFNTAIKDGNNVDTITDFGNGKDKFLLDHAIFKGMHMGQIEKSNFIEGSDAVTKDQHFIYDNGNVYYDADGSGAQDKILFAKVDENLHLTSAQFFIF